MPRLLSITAIALILAGHAPGARAESELDLFRDIDARLELMDEVAAYKWANDLAIEDVEREEIVLKQTTEGARRVGLEANSSRYFFHMQIEAAKAIQRHWFEKYEKGNPPGEAPDLLVTTRPKITALGESIIEGLSRIKVEPDDLGVFLEAVNVEGLSESTERSLFEALRQVRVTGKLNEIRNRGTIRVGTTGDYAPFSHAPQGRREFRGIDIDMARDLARYLEVDISFVKTSWPNLMEDLAVGAFDIGMSGISITEERGTVAYFSAPYFTGGKTPIARCDDVDRYDSLTAINRPEVRVVVNPGGTNYGFARHNLKDVQLRVHGDNRTIFDEIVEGRADVMVTDSIEVALKANQYEELCATMPDENFTFQQKGYLMPRDDAFKVMVDRWLEERLSDGTFQAFYTINMGLR